jgi:hypothetical protein
MRDRENLDKAIPFDQEGASTPAEQTHEHKMADSGFLLLSLTQLYLPLTWDLSRSEVHNLS